MESRCVLWRGATGGVVAKNVRQGYATQWRVQPRHMSVPVSPITPPFDSDTSHKLLAYARRPRSVPHVSESVDPRPSAALVTELIATRHRLRRVTDGLDDATR